MATGARGIASRNAVWEQDLRLAQRCSAREGAAIRELTGANNQRLFRAAWSILKDRAEAEEAVQSGYLKAFAALDGFAGHSSLSTWLTRIVVNEALGRRRSAARRKAMLEDEGVAMLDEYREPARPDALIAREQLRRMIEQAVASLPEIFRTVFVLRAVEGLSVEETAEVLGVAPATIKTRLLRARRRLQEALEPDVRSALQGVFPFAGADCEAMTGRLLATLQVR